MRRFVDSDGLRLTVPGGEFANAALEATFRAERFVESCRHARVLFMTTAGFSLLCVLIAILGSLTPSAQLAATGAGVLALCVSVSSLFVLDRVHKPQTLEWLFVAWQWGVAIAATIYVYAHDTRSLFLVLLLPTLLYLAARVSFILCLIGGLGTSLLLLLAYQGFYGLLGGHLDVAFTLLLLNVALAISVSHTNRMRRLQWASAQAERRTHQRLRESEGQLEAAFQAVPLPLTVTSLADGRVMKYNDATLRFYGGPAATLSSLRADDIYVDPSRREVLEAQLEACGHVTDFQLSLNVASGAVRDVIVAAAPMTMADEPCLVSVLVDVTERTAVEQKVRYAAHHDSLTGLPNRAAFQDSLHEALDTRRPDQGVCLLLVDLDGLKDANDSLGHDAGDAVLCEIARRLEGLAGEGARVARLGGDEFVILLQARDALRRGQRLAHAIVSDLRRPFFHARHQLSTRVSVGVASCPEHDSTYRELMKAADLALYAAKQQGRNRYVVYANDMRQAVQSRLSLLRAMTDALAQDEIEPYYQPKISLATGNLEGFEALVRWRRDKNTVLSPASFEMALNHPEMAVLINERMVQKVTRDVSEWISAGYQCGRIAINLSAAQFTQRDLAASLLGQFRNGGVDPANFDVEITETVFLGRDIVHVRATLHALRMMGVGVSFDDFGTGYASLVHLKQLPIDVIKIDRGFVKDIERDPFDTAIVRAVVDLARDLRLGVIAEGVETTGQARFLKDCGCEIAQGFLFYRPMAAGDVVNLLKRENETTALSRRTMFA